MPPKVLLDQIEFAARPAATWADLLDQIEEALDARGDVITSVRFDDVDQPDYRGTATLRRSLDNFATIEIDSEAPAMLMERALLEAIASIDPIQRGALDLSIGYRRNELVESNQRLGVLAEAIGNLMTIVGAAQKVLELDLDTLDVHGSTAAAIIGELDTTVSAIGAAHSARDWITLADLLEFDVVPMLPRLGHVIEKMTPTRTSRTR
jgi:hypothetical protein